MFEFFKMLARKQPAIVEKRAQITGFDIAIDRVLGHEGGYNNIAADPGGETNWGISKRSYPNEDIRRLTRDRAVSIYKRDFWDKVNGDQLPTGVAFQALDFAVNSGIGTAIRALQRAANVAEDGNVGPVTIAAINRMQPSDLTQRYIAERLEFYTKLSGWPTFGKGWIRRMAGNLRFGATDT